jgi:tRNA A58 N-methylase Trm61
VKAIAQVEGSGTAELLMVELGVGSGDLRRLLWANPHLTDMAVELEERRLDLAEKNIYEALRSDDSRRRDAASISPFATAIGLAGAVGSRRARARLS